MLKPLFCYLPIYKWPDGSCYKYYTLLQTYWGGITMGTSRLVADPSDLAPDVKSLKPDLVFCHGDWLSYWRVPFQLKIPYILFEHDIFTLRTWLTNSQKKQEREMIENAAGVIFTSEDHLEYCLSQYHIPNHGIVHLRPLKKDIAFNPLPKFEGKHLVYAGGILSEKHRGGSYGYRSYKDIFTRFMEAGWTVHVLGNYTHYETLFEYEAFGCKTHKWVPYPELLQFMSQCTAGLQAYAKQADKISFNYTQTCRPNKTWDYLAAGIPTIGLNAGNCAKIYTEGGWGVTIPDTNIDTLNAIKLPEIDPKVRMEQVMDNDLDVFDRVISKALNGKHITPFNDRRNLRGDLIRKRRTEGENDMINSKWHRVERTVVENGKVLYGKGRRITMSEAIRLHLVEDQTQVALKEKLAEKHADKIETKPLDTTSVEVETQPGYKAEDVICETAKDAVIDKYLTEHPEKLIGVDIASGSDYGVVAHAEKKGDGTIHVTDVKVKRGRPRKDNK